MLKCIGECSDGTLQGLSQDLRNATEEMKKADCSITSVQSGCELFQRFITLAALDQPVNYNIQFLLDYSLNFFHNCEKLKQ